MDCYCPLLFMACCLSNSATTLAIAAFNPSLGLALVPLAPWVVRVPVRLTPRYIYIYIYIYNIYIYYYIYIYAITPKNLFNLKGHLQE